MSEPDSLQEVVGRTLHAKTREPAAPDVLRLYLELPIDVESYHGPTKQTMRVRSSFEAAFADAEGASNGGTSFIGAIGHLCFLDQLGGALRRADCDPQGHNCVEKALSLFSGVVERERAGLYALRCALAHDYSLANHATRVSDERRHLYRHHFQLWPRRQLNELIEFPAEPWDGSALDVADTHVDLGHLQDLARSVRARVLELHAMGVLRLAMPPAEIRRRYFFIHEAAL